MFSQRDPIMSSSITVNDIFRKYGHEYRILYPNLSLHEKKVMRAIEICRTEALGGRIEECDHCGHKVVLYNSCRNRHCPQCQFMKKEQWIMARKKEILPFTYFHVVFTLPDKLNSIVIKNQKIIYNLFFQKCRETLLSIGEEKKYLGAKIGFFSILHTWGQKLNFHPHLHCVVPGGGYSETKNKWIQSSHNFLFPVQVLKIRFRSLFLKGLKELYRTNKLYLNGTPYLNSITFQNLIDTLFKKEWVIYLKESFKNNDSVIEYLARYTHRIAISNHRIISLKNDIVTFKYRDYKDNNKEKNMEMQALSFMRYFMIHVVPRRFVRIRYYGLLSHRNKKKAIEECRNFFKIIYKDKEVKLEWSDIYLKVTGKNIHLCPACKKGTLILKEYIPEKRYESLIFEQDMSPPL